MAARATFALKAGLCVRRARLAIVTPDMRHSRRSQADFPLIGLSEFAQPPLLAILLSCQRRIPSQCRLTVLAASIIGWRRLWVAQKYHVLRKASASWRDGC